MLITTILLTLVMVIIWRTPRLLVVLYFTVFFIVEGVYVSAVFTKIPEGGWFPFAISIILAFVMFGWHYGRQRKLDYEMNHRITLDSLTQLLSNPEIQRVSGLCFFYGSILDGLMPILSHYISNMSSFHEVAVFTSLRYMPVAKVAPNERIVVKRLGLRGLYDCLIQYGYEDSFNQEGNDFVSQVLNSLQEHIRRSSDGVSSVSMSIVQELSELERAKRAGVVHVRGKTRFHLSESSGWFDKILLRFYEVLHSNCRSALPALGIPLQQCVEVGMLYKA